jgi:hypothetical protein
MIIFGLNKSLLQAIKMKFLALEQQKEKKSFKISFSFLHSPNMFLHHKLEEGLNYLSVFKI